MARSVSELRLEDEVDELKMSNIRLIAELGRVASALGVEPSMMKVLAKIEELKNYQSDQLERERNEKLDDLVRYTEELGGYNDFERDK